ASTVPVRAPRLGFVLVFQNVPQKIGAISACGRPPLAFTVMVGTPPGPLHFTLLHRGCLSACAGRGAAVRQASNPAATTDAPRGASRPLSSALTMFASHLCGSNV